MEKNYSWSTTRVYPWTLPFNIFLSDIYLYIENSDLCNKTDDSTLYASGKSLPIIIENLKADFLRISKWFHEIFVLPNSDKCHFMVPTR